VTPLKSSNHDYISTTHTSDSSAYLSVLYMPHVHHPRHPHKSRLPAAADSDEADRLLTVTIEFSALWASRANRSWRAPEPPDNRKSRLRPNKCPAIPQNMRLAQINTLPETNRWCQLKQPLDCPLLVSCLMDNISRDVPLLEESAQFKSAVPRVPRDCPVRTS